MAHLAAVNEADFLALRKLLDLSDGNLSVHTTVLESKGYIECDKSFVGRKPRTTYRITPSGRRAFEEYVAALEGILRGGVDPTGR